MISRASHDWYSGKLIKNKTTPSSMPRAVRAVELAWGGREEDDECTA